MKKILVTLVVLALCAPAMAATITLADIGGGQATITVATEEGEDNIVGLGLDVVVTGGEVTAVDVAALAVQKFDIFPDYAYFVETDTDPNGYEYGEGHPVAAMEEAGKLELPQSIFALSLGNLNGIDIAGADGAAEVVITVDWSGDLLEVCENATRGGIVANGEEEAGLSLDADCAELEGAPAECIDPAAATHADWVAFGSPECWCFQRQCNGEIDGSSVGTAFSGIRWVTTNDLDILLAAFNVYEPGGTLNSGPGVLSILGGQGVCADLDHLGVGTAFSGIRRVTTNDLDALLASFNVYEPGGTLNSGPGVPVCGLYPTSDIAFYTN